MLKIGTTIYKPCSLDILEFKVTEYSCSEDCVIYTLKATHPIGAQGRIEVLVTGTNNRLHYAGTPEDDDGNCYSRGLMDFIEGEYFTEKAKARLAFYDDQSVLSWASMREAERLFEERKATNNRIQAIIKQIKDEMAEGQA